MSATASIDDSHGVRLNTTKGCVTTTLAWVRDRVSRLVSAPESRIPKPTLIRREGPRISVEILGVPPNDVAVGIATFR
jgi:hypothetical protein